MSIEIWAAQLERPLSEREASAIMKVLPPMRRVRLLQMKDVEKRREPLCAYLLLCLALRRTYGWKELPLISLSSTGKPFFPEHATVHFNLSHTRGAVLVALSDQPVGVDIERIRPVSQRAMERLAKVTTEEDFFRSWVRREARAKRSGLGVGTMMRSESPLSMGEYYHELETFPGYVAGVATRSTDQPKMMEKYVLDEIL